MNSIRLIKVRSGKNMLIIIMLISIALIASGFVWAHKQVRIVADGTEVTISTFSSKPESVLSQAGITLKPLDEYRMSTSELSNGTTVKVYRAVPVVLTYQGKNETITTGKPTVGELAVSMGIQQDNIRLIPDANTNIEAGMNIRAITLSEKIEQREVPEPFSTLYNPDPDMEKGLEQVAQEGESGTKLVTVKMYLADDQVEKEDILSEKIIEPAKNCVINMGTRDTVETSRGTMRFSRTRMMEATAYLPTDGSAEGLTATGIPARYGIVAVDPNVIPLGTRLYVRDYGLALAADTGGAIIGDRIDLCMEDDAEAWAFGRRTVKVYVLE